jgi:hypothetical protein
MGARGRHFDEHDVAELGLGEIGDAYGGGVAFDRDPLMFLGVIDAH